MPLWMQIIAWVFGGLVACIALWKGMVIPLSELLVLHREVRPMLQKMVKKFEDNPNFFESLSDIAKQFHTNSGTSLRDVINKLDSMLQVLQTTVEASALLDEKDRAKVARVEERLNEVSARVGPLDEYKPQLAQILADLSILAAQVKVNTVVAATAQAVAVESRASLQTSVDQLATPPKEIP